MIHPGQLAQYVVIPVLEEMGMMSPAAYELVMYTGMQESRFTYLHQLSGGPALGFFQMEPATHADIWENHIEFNDRSMNAVVKVCGCDEMMPHEMLIYDLRYATAMCRLHYWRRPEALPEAGNLDQMAAYWKQFYNTHLGHGTVDQFVAHAKELRKHIDFGGG